jgi:hypothetical protein
MADDRLSGPPPGDDWIPPDTLAGDLSLTPDQMLDRLSYTSSIPVETISELAPPPDPLSPGPDGIIPGDALSVVLSSIQAKLDQVIVGQGSLWGEIGNVRRELGNIALVAASSKEIVTAISNKSLREDSELRRFAGKVAELSDALKCPQEQCLAWRMIGKASGAARGSTGG